MEAAARIRHVDYVSLDVEGAKAEILKSFPFATVTVSAWSVENPYDDPRIPAAMTANGYALQARIGVDDINLPA